MEKKQKRFNFCGWEIDMKWNYATDKEANILSPDEFDLQIVLGLQSCKTKNDVMDLLKDVRQHERLQLANKTQKRISKTITDAEREEYY